MAPAKKQTAISAEVALVSSLKSCLVNLPSSLVAALNNANTVTQNVVVEISFRQQLPSSATDRPAAVQRSIFVGWTGMQSKRRLAPVVSRDGLVGSRGGPQAREQDVAVVELDPVFARLLGLMDNQKVGLSLHVDPPQAHTINIEPLTPADWEMIELHAQFLELNFLSQVRALPNPLATDADGTKLSPHPITLHLSPTSTANVVVVAVDPSPSNNFPFVKISPDAEIIVAPKERSKERRSDRDTRSSTSKRSVGGRSATSTVRRKGARSETAKGSAFLRGVDRGLVTSWFDGEDESMRDEGLRVWIDRDLLHEKTFKGAVWVAVSVIKPSGIMEKPDPQKEAAETEKPTQKVVARLGAWNDAPDPHHAGLSSLLCQTLSSEGMIGGLIRIEPAPAPLDPSSIRSKDGSSRAGLKVTPFIGPTKSIQASSIKFGGETKQEKEESARNLREIMGKVLGNTLLDGALTEGMLLPAIPSKNWYGGILRLHPPLPRSESLEQPVHWLMAPEKPLPIDFEPEIARPSNALRGWSPGETLPTEAPALISMDSLVQQIVRNLEYSSSVLLTGGLGSGKTSVAQLVAHHLVQESLFFPVYFPCRTRLLGEYKVSNIKETLERLFAAASWGARLGGRAVVILDDLDSICFAETELGEGGDNVRSKHISEGLCAIVRHFCSINSGVVLLATAQSKEALNNVIIGGHVVQEITNLSAPNKEMRRRVLEALVSGQKSPAVARPGSADAGRALSTSRSRPTTSDGAPGFDIDSDVDFLDLAGQTDGYMPGDLVVLAARTRSECLIRCVSDSTSDDTIERLTLTSADFSAALKGFTPASLRNVTLQTSTVKWSSIGGLKETRQVLLETLQYPTTYAPIFSKCPLRLRSGILLYGFPGCGKTLLASAIASECGLNFIAVKGPEILNKYIGASEKSVRDLFDRAQAARPCVLFFDEFDSIAPKRGHDSTGVTDRVVNQLLTQMDGAEGLEGVYVLAATSRPDLIDPALLRPGRLDKSIICDMPNHGDRVDILTAVSRNLKIDAEVQSRWSEIARRSEGMSGADLQALVYNAQLEAVHELLGDADLSTGKDGSKSANGSINGSSKRIPDFDVFRMNDADGTGAGQEAKSLAERTVVAAKLREMATLRRRQRASAKAALQQEQQQRRSDQQDSIDSADEMFDASPVPAHSRPGGVGGGAKSGADSEHDQDENDEPVVRWRHIEKSLNTTRSSISPEERKRLDRIYREFVTGRSGDLPSGQGGTEIGGRTSLM